jgi:Aspartyl protease/Domain of unknown function (DUF4124)
MQKYTVGLILILVLIPVLALAEIYYWVDQQGVRYYTTRFESIPEPYRSNALRLPTLTSPPTPPAPQSGPLPNRLAVIPFTSGSPVLVSAKINGAGPATLILDTGSDRTLIAPSVLSRLGISTENPYRAVIKGVTGTSDADAVWVNSLEVGEAKVGPLLIIAHDAGFHGADGLLGRDFLDNFKVTIDSKGQVVTLRPN